MPILTLTLEVRRQSIELVVGESIANALYFGGSVLEVGCLVARGTVRGWCWATPHRGRPCIRVGLDLLGSGSCWSTNATGADERVTWAG